MSIPKSKVLNVSKGFGASAEIYHSSPAQTSVGNVNVAEKQVPEVEIRENTNDISSVDVPITKENTEKNANELLNY